MKIHREVRFGGGKVWLNGESLTQKFPKNETPYGPGVSLLKSSLSTIDVCRDIFHNLGGTATTFDFMSNPCCTGF